MSFINDDFILTNETAKKLYHDYAENMPIIDYHCHINPKEIYENKKFKNITEIWLGGDHYKWRLIRSNGVMLTITLSFYDLPKCCHAQSATLCIIGIILNLKDISIMTAF